jgi:RNA polymerase sigma factor (sigma-70 family)
MATTNKGSSHFISAEDQQIIDQIREGGKDRRKKEDELFERHSYFIKEGISKFKLTQEDAFDAYSDSVLSAIDKISRGIFEGRSSLKTYLYQIFSNKCVDFLRKKTTNKYSVHRGESISEQLIQLSDAAKTIVQQLIDKADFAQLKLKLNHLGETCRALLLLWSEDYSDKEIALELEYKNADVAKSSRLRCLDRLKKLYQT